MFVQKVFAQKVFVQFMSHNILTSYSFLASLNETGTDMYNAVYVPMCKRAVSLYASKRKQNHGTALDIKQIISEEYGIDIPILVTKS